MYTSLTSRHSEPRIKLLLTETAPISAHRPCAPPSTTRPASTARAVRLPIAALTQAGTSSRSSCSTIPACLRARTLQCAPSARGWWRAARRSASPGGGRAGGGSSQWQVARATQFDAIVTQGTFLQFWGFCASVSMRMSTWVGFELNAVLHRSRRRTSLLICLPEAA
jgi:hypothetical protein